MTFVLVAIIGALAVVLYLGVRFTIFKSKLMSEFGLHGISYEEADDIFAINGKCFSDLYLAGVPIENIVLEYLRASKADDLAQANKR